MKQVNKKVTTMAIFFWGIGILCMNSFVAGTPPSHHADLVSITALCPSIQLDIKYATADNFTKQAVYKNPGCFLRREAAEKLAQVQQELEEIGLSLLIWDAYRPLKVQKIFWDLVPDERYVANPAQGSRHNRGCAVDCTIVKKDGTPLLMPTEFDNFTEKAHRNCLDLPQEAIANRTLLEDLMTQHGFIGIPTEWWHFDLIGWEQYPILDKDFAELQ